MKTRSLVPEIMDQPNPPEDVERKFHRDLKLIHTLLGNWGAVIARLGKGPRPKSVMDIGCGDGALLREIRAKLGVDNLVGVDLRPPDCVDPTVPIVAADATREPLPQADVAVSVVMLHHLTDEQAVAMIRNVGRSAKRFVLLDLVRHPLPLVLYTVFMCPLLSSVGAQDGRQSIRRAYKPEELRALVNKAIAGTGATFEHWVSPVYARQVLDIRYHV